MSRDVSFKLTTLTPLWTGGVNDRCDRLHETGIIGSLRWWFEALVRGLGGEACDPTEHRCPIVEGDDKDPKYCPACLIFGATGLKRAFRIYWEDEIEKPNTSGRLKIRVNNNTGWYLYRGLLFSKASGRLLIDRTPSDINKEGVIQIITLVLKLASEWGGLGARTQQGYGVVNINDGPELDLEKALAVLETLVKSNGEKKNITSTQHNDPRLDYFFFSKIRVKANRAIKLFSNKRLLSVYPKDEFDYYLKKDILPVAPVIRYYLREMARNNIRVNNIPNAPARWRLLGVLKGIYHKRDYRKFMYYCAECDSLWQQMPKREGHKCKSKVSMVCTACKGSNEKETMERYKSLINVSHAYKVNRNEYELRIWG